MRFDPHATILLVLICAVLVVLVRHSRSRMAHFRTLEESERRRAMFRQWTWQSFAAYTGGAIVILALLGRIPALLAFPQEFDPLRSADDIAQAAGGTSWAEMGGMLTGLLLGGMAVFVVWRFILRKRGQPVIGDVAALFPRNYRESGTLIPLALNAGFSEEIFFRLALPLVAVQATGSAQAGFAIAAIVFGLMHWYQGWRGMLLTGLASLFFIGLYLRTGSLLAPIVVHAGVDLIALVIRPSLSLWLDAREARHAAPREMGA